MNVLGLITRPVELAVWVGREAVGLAGAAVGEVRSALGGVMPGGDEGRAADATVEVPIVDGPPTPPAASVPPPSARPARDLDEPVPPAPPAVPPTAKTLDDAPVPAGEFGEVGFEEDAGPQISIAEPWEGYESMSTDELRERIGRASQEVLATVVLYEGANGGREGVIRAAERRLAELAASN